METQLVNRYAVNMHGVLSCYDRILIMGTLPGACYADGMSAPHWGRVLLSLRCIIARPDPQCPELALRLGALLGNGAQLWVDMQTKYDLWQAEAKLHDVLKGMRRLDRLAVA